MADSRPLTSEELLEDRLLWTVCELPVWVSFVASI
jgi:hypothetical protein